MVEIILDEYQQQAVDRSSDPSNRFTIVTGSAGTGKTTIMKMAYNNLLAQGYKIALVAPTGKAAKRIQEATGIPAMTIHRLLEFPKPNELDEKTGIPLNDSYPKRNSNNKLEQNCIMCDEYSMVGHLLHKQIIDALPSGSIMRIFGDKNQLPAIEKEPYKHLAPLFTSLIEQHTPLGNCITLRNIHRNDDGNIATEAAKILKGIPTVQHNDFRHHYTNDPIGTILDLMDNDQSYFTLRSQIITPKKDTNKISAYYINKIIQETFVADVSKPSLRLERNKWDTEFPVTVFVGDKILITKNDYNLEMFNGEVGIITDLSDDGVITVDLEDRIVEIPPIIMSVDRNGKSIQYNPQKEINLAYCVTTHKSQGCEFTNVIYVINTSSGGLLCRPNFYTAVTRARKEVNIVTDHNAYRRSLANAKQAF